MDPKTRERLFGYEHAFDQPVTLWITVAIVGVLAFTPLVIRGLFLAGKISAEAKTELVQRYRSWLVIVPLMLVPILLGAAWTILAVTILSVLCYREFARATGLFREKLVSFLVALGIFALAFATIDHWYNFFNALTPLSILSIAAINIAVDRPTGYIQRVALGVFAFTLFGTCLGHLAYFANDWNYRSMLILIFLAVELNDVFAYVVGKTLGSRKLVPNTSPKKTVGGSLGALALTTLLVVGLGQFVFAGTKLDTAPRLVGLGLLISVLGQLGDLMLSSIKRDLGIKDMGAVIPGHGGILDRFDSIILVAPAAFHYIGYFLDNGIGLDQPTRIISGG